MIDYFYSSGGLKHKSFSDALKSVGPISINFGALKNYLGSRYSIPPETLVDGITRETVLVRNCYHRINTLEQYILDAKPKHNFMTAILISGGVDSSVLAKLYDDPGMIFVFVEPPTYSEKEWVDILAPELKGRILYLKMDDANFMRCCREIYSQIDYPIGDSAVVAVYYAAQEASRYGVDCLVVGEGGDESFGGYSAYPRIKSLNQWDWSLMHRHYSIGFSWFPKKLTEYLIKNDHERLYYTMNWDRYVQVVNLYAYKNIWGARLAGLKCELPYISRELWEWIDGNIKDSLVIGEETKSYFKKFALEIGVPEKIVYRKKSGFNVFPGPESINIMKKELVELNCPFKLDGMRPIDLCALWSLTYYWNCKGVRIWL
jgi:asparagine synthetase B (glutamine-hydrolysing)